MHSSTGLGTWREALGHQTGCLFRVCVQVGAGGLILLWFLRAQPRVQHGQGAPYMLVNKKQIRKVNLGSESPQPHLHCSQLP